MKAVRLRGWLTMGKSKETKEAKQYTIKIMNEEIRIMSDDSEEHIRQVENYVIDTIKSFYLPGVDDPLKYPGKGFFASFLIANDLLKAREELEEAKKEAAALKEDNKKLVMELVQATEEFGKKRRAARDNKDIQVG